MAVWIENVSKKYPLMQELAVNQVSLHIEKGKTLALLGESGSGKTTLLRLLAGLEQLTEGKIRVHNTTVSAKTAQENIFVKPEKRKIGMFFQNYALFPHLNVAENIAYGLDKTTDKATRIAEMLELVELQNYQKRYPHELSGGQQQRIALARALAPRPSLLLLDEPFSNLDEQLKLQVRKDIKTIIEQSQTTSILVTHDLQDALALADTLAVMRNGKIEQLGTAQELYQTPQTHYVATLFGKVQNISPTVFTRPEWITLREKSIKESDLEVEISAINFQGNAYQVSVKDKVANQYQILSPTYISFEVGQKMYIDIKKTFSLS